MSQANQEHWIEVFEFTFLFVHCTCQMKNLLWKSDLAMDTWSKAIAKLNGLHKKTLRKSLAWEKERWKFINKNYENLSSWGKRVFVV